MKNSFVLFIAAFIFTIFSVNTAAAQKHKYYYYPSSNVYYDAGPGLYYYNQGSTWTGVRALPPGFSIARSAPRYVVYHQGPDVWVNNGAHVVKYKNYKNKPNKYKHGKAKGHDKQDRHGKKH